jgi:hypothetical protein
MRAAVGKLSAGVSLSEAQRAGTSGPAGDFIAAALAEMRMAADATDKDALKERIASRLERIEAA